MANPTIVMLTDRNDLDDQLFTEVFAPTRNLPEDPVRASDRRHLRQLLTRPAGGIVFTTMQKFAPDEKGDEHPLLTDRRNVVVVADEAHRSQYAQGRRSRHGWQRLGSRHTGRGKARVPSLEHFPS